MGQKLDTLFSTWVEKARLKPSEGHKANLNNGETLFYFPASAKVEVWKQGEMPQKGQATFGPWLQECAMFEQLAQNAGLTLSNRRMQAGTGKFCARWTAHLTMQRAV
jgi:hypothetical protein